MNRMNLQQIAFPALSYKTLLLRQHRKDDAQPRTTSHPDVDLKHLESSICELTSIILTSHFKAKRGQTRFKITRTGLVIFTRGPMMRKTGEMTPPSSNFHARPTEAQLTSTYLTRTIPDFTAVLFGIRFQTWNHPEPKSRPYHQLRMQYY
ncbi:hypothetical protein AVEN_157938-1 [Araneus ventricosus]|uniref:Uncharacterized protein n=1 Tax=Araneus ventricosus TaxID=182803 RepID=A0A4Y2H891_ARAVE|nr:hypothetical protein AVEN_157938-1 [Araneus ventricosus]